MKAWRISLLLDLSSPTRTAAPSAPSVKLWNLTIPLPLSKAVVHPAHTTARIFSTKRRYWTSEGPVDTYTQRATQICKNGRSKSHTWKVTARASTGSSSNSTNRPKLEGTGYFLHHRLSIHQLGGLSQAHQATNLATFSAPIRTELGEISPEFLRRIPTSKTTCLQGKSTPPTPDGCPNGPPTPHHK